MKIPETILDDMAQRAKSLPAGLMKRRKPGYTGDSGQPVQPADLSNRQDFLSFGDVQPSPVEYERLLGTNDLVDEFYLERALLSANPVCRISIRESSGHERGCATGFMVSPRLLLTNHHVFGSAAEAVSSIAEFNYRLDIAGRPEVSYIFQLQPDEFFFNNEELDFALVAVNPRSVAGDKSLGDFGYLRLIAQSGKALVNEWMTIIQHPGGARRQFAIRENQCVADSDPQVIWYISDTAQGSSGSPVFNDSFQVAALHHAGVPRQDADGNYLLKSGKAVKDLQDVDDADVDWAANAGIRISRICECLMGQAPEMNGHLAELKTSMQGGDILTNAYQGGGLSRAASLNLPAAPVAGLTGNRLVLGSLVLELNNNLSLMPGLSGVLQPGATGATAAPLLGDQSSAMAESFKEPIVDTHYESRKGFDTTFLGISTPLPRVKTQALIAPMLDGRKVIPYEHFSLVLHKTRKLAIFTASNVDGSSKAKFPEPGKDYTRSGLTGLGNFEMEKWVIDPRVDVQFQIPDAFYNKDNGAFDKGHIVRREDVCFGGDYAQVQRANGDTFHVTNCSPQRGNFNRSGSHGIWGQLENFVGAQSGAERYCIFAGPVLSPQDKIFVGTERVMLPDRFWKVICAIKDGKLQVFAFVLAQDIKDLPLEFQVTAAWKPKQVALKDLETTLGIVKFQKIYHAADQF
ncbi:MAG TPA: DNA/RNA non-specific endonuclease [Anaerolineales bacterium]|jgi:endonuclease G